MISASAAPFSAPLSRRTRWLVVLLLALYAAIALLASRHKGVSFDEAEQLACGYDIWERHDFRMETANGDLIKRWATLPYLVSRPKLPARDDPAWRAGEPYVFGYRFFFASGNRPESLLLQGRAMAVLLGVALGLLVFACSRELFGEAGGLVSLAVFAFGPHVLAFGGVVSTEISISLTLLGATWCIWRLLHAVTWGRLAASTGMFALLLLAKPTALVLIPIAAVLVAVKLFAGPPMRWRLGREWTIVRIRAQLAVIVALVALHVAVGWGAIWANYEFRYAASPEPGNPSVVLRERPGSDPIGSATLAVVRWSRREHVLPEGFVHGIRWLLGSDDTRAAFMDGRWRIGGWRMFFPYALWVKSSPWRLLLLAGGLAGWWWWRHRPEPARRGRMPGFYPAVPYVTLIVVYLGIAMAQNLNIGHRHVLPVYPAFDVLIGASVVAWETGRRWLRIALAAVLALFAGESVALYPDYLAYFNPLVGGPKEGYRRLVDSSVDWGMDLPGLRDWLARHNADGREPVFLAYFGTDSPDYYGIKCTRLPGFFDLRPRQIYAFHPGIYAISATLLQSVYTSPLGPWNPVAERDYQTRLRYVLQLEDAGADPGRRAALLRQFPREFWDLQYDAYEKLRFARLCAWLRQHRPPDAEVGYSILIWRLTTADLKEAVFGPSPDEAERPLRVEG